MKRACIYHGGCPDGFGAAWATWRAWEGEGKFIARGHDDRVRGEDFEDSLVAFVDIAPDNDELRELVEHAAQVIILDHHVTSKKRFEADLALGNELTREGHVAHFDMGHSGAMLAWQYFMPDEPAPDLLRYVEDQDIWTWKLPGSEEVNAAIDSYPHDFEVWSAMARRPVEELEREGASIVRANRQAVERSLRRASTLAIGSRRIEAVNSANNRSASTAPATSTSRRPPANSAAGATATPRVSVCRSRIGCATLFAES